MSGKYYQKIGDKLIDVCDLCALKKDGTSDFSTHFKGEQDFQQAGTDTTNITLTDFKVNGTPCTTVQRGYMPANGWIWSLTTPRTYRVSRSDEALTITTGRYYDTTIATLKAERFRDNIVPYELVILIAGGGGGGGGYGYIKYAKNDFRATCPGGAGGGGGIFVCRVRLTEGDFLVKVGSGGKAGSDGVSNESSAGHNGGDGESSFIQLYHNSSVKAYANSGSGGYGGNYGDSGTPGAGGNGGGGGIIRDNYGDFFITSKVCNGSKGNQFDNFNNAGAVNLTFAPTQGTGGAGYTFVNQVALTGNAYNTYKSDTTFGSIFSGGNSYGNGAYTILSGMGGDVPAGYGGGGQNSGDGGNGIAIFYY
jgi:hypothetical protein